jgi:hypothetical protein
VEGIAEREEDGEAHGDVSVLNLLKVLGFETQGLSEGLLR